jgi:hypothetical protein
MTEPWTWLRNKIWGSSTRTTRLVHNTLSSRIGLIYANPPKLNLQMVAGLSFPFYSEARIDFLPTYKFDVGTDRYDTSYVPIMHTIVLPANTA